MDSLIFFISTYFMTFTILWMLQLTRIKQYKFPADVAEVIFIFP